MITGIEEKVHPEKWKIAPHVNKLETSIIREILKFSSQPGVLSFAGGLPAPEMFPIAELKTICTEVLEKYDHNATQYSLSRGIVPLRELLAKRATERGTPSTVENILITSGSQQGIELVARAFIDPGDYILTENPTYLGALQAFNYYQARYCTVPMDGDGMLVDQVAETIEKYKPKLIYSVSNFQNPTGVTMSVERRKKLVQVAASYDIPIIDDNPYGDIRFAGERVPTLKSFGGDEVIALRTFSKTVAPGFRIGWMNGPNSIIAQFEKVKQCADLHTSTFNQYVMYEFVNRGLLETHVEKIKADYLLKRDTMLEAMRQHFPKEITWTEPEGGLFLWVTLPEGMSAKDLFNKAIDLKVAYVYGSPFFPNGGGDNTLRLNFSNTTLDGIKDGIQRLGKLFSENM
ncbi:aminotransferase class I/II-fold pyridoxal phosphate-dependent enzyme [candidate division GN15 bacterium]|nr:aminotransferase class I/II-fold pyridoxal phosphate-dependent enzyme [candidate division GN15 bacterium]